MAPRALVLTGHGINCEEETQYAFTRAGARADIVHVNDLIARHKKLNDYQILAIPGGFSYGDDTGSGNAMAQLMRNHLWDELLAFVDQDKLTIGICNGFQVLTRLGLVPALQLEYGEPQVSLVHNDGARYLDRWVDIEFTSDSPWTAGLHRMSVPIAHGEGKLYAPQSTLQMLRDRECIAARYVAGKMCEYQSLPANPNGSLDDIAALQDESGKVFGLMPHPERAMDFTHMPDWPLVREIAQRNNEPTRTEGPGLAIFRNGVYYFD